MNILELFEKIKVFVLDMDGVLTDGMLYMQENGELLRRMNIKDGYAMQLAIRKGYKVYVISGGKSEAAKLRLEKLGITSVYMAVEDKKDLLQQLIASHSFEKENILYMGDDMPDISAMNLAGLKCCPQDAASDIKNISDYISPLPGGQGCVRDVIEKVLKINDNWE